MGVFIPISAHMQQTWSLISKIIVKNLRLGLDAHASMKTLIKINSKIYLLLGFRGGLILTNNIDTPAPIWFRWIGATCDQREI